MHSRPLLHAMNLSDKLMDLSKFLSIVSEGDACVFRRPESKRGCISHRVSRACGLTSTLHLFTIMVFHNAARSSLWMETHGSHQHSCSHPRLTSVAERGWCHRASRSTAALRKTDLARTCGPS